MSLNGDDMVKMFSLYQETLNSDQNLRESNREVYQGLDQIYREVATVQQSIHLVNGLQKIPEIIRKTDELVASSGSLYAKLSSLIPQDEYYKYHEQWKWVTQRLIFAMAFVEFLRTGKLLTKESSAASLSIKNTRAEGFHLDMEDYLHGLLQLTSELSRLAVTSATSGDYRLPVQISQFVTELNAGFMLINFKNDSLRKKYDALKYDQKKIEEVVYDLSIRGLIKT